jgi:hypothetical protein
VFEMSHSGGSRADGGGSNLTPLCGVPEVVVSIRFFILVVGDGIMSVLALACGYE